MSNGRAIDAGGSAASAAVRLTFEDRLVAVARREDDLLKPEVVFA